MSLSVLEEYIETGNHHDLNLVLGSNPDLVHEQTSHEISPLLLACYYNKHQIVQVILKYIKRISIHEACAAGLYPQVEAMIAQKPDVIEEISSHGFTPLGISAHFSQTDIVRLLLRHGADPDVPSQNGYNVYPLHSSLGANHVEISKMLIEAGADVNALQSSRISPLHLAAQHGNIELIVLLLEHGADISVVNDVGMTASDIAYEKGFREIGDILKV